MAHSAQNLTKDFIERIRPPATGRDTYKDQKVPFLQLRVAPSGSQVFYFYRKVRGKVVRIKLGAFPELTVTGARKIAEDYAGQYARGEDPAAARRPGSGMTFGELFTHYMVHHARPNKRTWAEDQRKFDKTLHIWKNVPAIELTTAQVLRLRTKIGHTQGKPYAANRTLALVSAVYSYGIGKLKMKMDNPAASIGKYKETERKRYLKPHELPALFDALEELGADPGAMSKEARTVWWHKFRCSDGPTLRDFFLVLLFTGQRRSNVAAMRWQDVDLADGTWTIPGEVFKNEEEHRVMLVPEVQAILKRRQTEQKGPWAFPAPSKSGHLQDPRKAWARVLAAAEMPGVRMHDLRRTLGSWQAGQGASMKIVGASLGHKDLKVTSKVYAHLDADPVRKSMEGAVAAMLAARDASPQKDKQDTKTDLLTKLQGLSPEDKMEILRELLG